MGKLSEQLLNVFSWKNAPSKLQLINIHLLKMQSDMIESLKLQLEIMQFLNHTDLNSA